EIYSIIDSKLSKLESELSGVMGYTVNWDRYIDYDSELKNYVVKINVEITTRFMEISESCSEYTYEDIIEYYGLEIPNEILESVDNLEDLPDPYYSMLMEHSDRYYNECVDNLLEEINYEYALNSNIEFENEYVKIKSYPILCTGNYCEIGGGVDIVIKSIDKHVVEKALEIVENVLMLFRYY
ncbi:MAG: hypothetical protein QXR31_06245, partial [Zestosphaera sp.]